MACLPWELGAIPSTGVQQEGEPLLVHRPQGWKTTQKTAWVVVAPFLDMGPDEQGTGHAVVLLGPLTECS